MSVDEVILVVPQAGAAYTEWQAFDGQVRHALDQLGLRPGEAFCIRHADGKAATIAEHYAADQAKEEQPYVGDDDHAPWYIDRGGRDIRKLGDQEDGL